MKTFEVLGVVNQKDLVGRCIFSRKTPAGCCEDNVVSQDRNKQSLDECVTSRP